ncbi:hypothetical protein MKW98_008359 [Papaver atlanticum]|uniref:Fatty acyl-CoA reductase n=1 Tax=Papaver atlanticum TaxID=357466 RepID=A0AAD4SCT8_9MAGN|nr:hypothetical protein MKW98_008359 [Papaver atlanticum]
MEFNGSIVEFLENKSILVTGSTGFLGKVFVEKLLRVQPNLRHLFLLLRDPDPESAKERLHTEITSKELFRVLKTTYGAKFNTFISEKVTAIAGDIALKNFGLGEDSDLLNNLIKDVDIVARFAATTKFIERYDVALEVNTLGAKNVLDFAKKCAKLEMLAHVSTAYVCGEKSGVISEKPLMMGETLNQTLEVLDIEAELKHMRTRLEELKSLQVSKSEETEAMENFGLERFAYFQQPVTVSSLKPQLPTKSLILFFRTYICDGDRARAFGWPNTYVFTKAMGEMLIGKYGGKVPVVIIRPTIITSTCIEPFPGWIESARTIDTFLIAGAEGKLPCFLGNAESMLDVVPGDMVANAVIVAMAVNSNHQSSDPFIYQVCSSQTSPLSAIKLRDYSHTYLLKNPLIGKDGNPINVVMPICLPTMDSFRPYIFFKYMLPLKVLELVNAALCQYFKNTCKVMNRKINRVMYLVEVHEPYIFFEGKFDDLNTERLRMAIRTNEMEAKLFYFDPKSLDWDDYFVNIHIPGLAKHVFH